MFSNLKHKIFEASPPKLQQFAQAAQAAVSSSTSNSTLDSIQGSESFFSIAEEETPQNSPVKTSQISTEFETSINTLPILPTTSGPNSDRIRKTSNSSISSDISFRLPTYESPAVYHLQSDLDISASEIEDSTSTSSAALEYISKEQLHNAYKKSVDRYHKYRSRYTDLARKYRDLERDSSKARAVLVETQDKAIRRISELREQCSLEQQAKAHLEEALRLEMDDMQCQIKTYKTKLNLLEEANESSNKAREENLIQLEPCESNLLNNENQVQIPDNNNLLQLISAKDKEITELKANISETNKKIFVLKKQEEENAILLAKNKQMIHSELENKEKEVKQLKAKISTLKNNIVNLEKETISLRKKTADISEIQIKLKEMTAIKQDFEAKYISTDHIFNKFKKEHESKTKELQRKLECVKEEYEDKLSNLKLENDGLKELIQRGQQKEGKICETQINGEIQNKEGSLNQNAEININLQSELEHYQNLIKESNEKMQNFEKENEYLQQQLIQNEENIQKILLEKSSNEKILEKENNELKLNVANILKEIERMEVEFKELKNTRDELEIEKQTLEEKCRVENQKFVENFEISEKNLLITQELKNLKSEIEVMDSRHEKEKKYLTAKIQENEEKLTNFQSQYEINQAKLTKITEEYRNAQKSEELIQIKLTELQENFKKKEQEIHGLLEINNCLTNEIQEIRKKNELLQIESEKKDNSFENLRNEYEQLQQKLSLIEENKTNINRIHEEKENLKTEILSLDKTNKEIRKELETKKCEYLTILNKNENMARDNLDLQKKLQEQQQQNLELKEQNEVFAKEIDILKNNNQTRLNELENMLKRTNDEKQSLKESIKNATDFEKKLQNYENLKIENEYLNTLTNQLETDLRKFKEDKSKLEVDLAEQKEKQQSLQCELYVLREDKENHALELNTKLIEIENLHKSIKDLSSLLELKNQEIKRESDHNGFITQQNDNIQIELLSFKKKIGDAEISIKNLEQNNEMLIKEKNELILQIEAAKNEKQEDVEGMKNQLEANKVIVNDLSQELMQATTLLDKLQNVELENKCLNEEVEKLKEQFYSQDSNDEDSNSLALISSDTKEAIALKEENEKLKHEIEDIKHNTSVQTSNLITELNHLKENFKHLKEKLSDYEQNIDISNETNVNTNSNISSEEYNALNKEKNELDTKLTKIMHEVEDVSNRNIFLEQKCENYLILEQSNERLKLSNEKLSRQLDETLVSLHHSEGISANTEFEYLKNIMFQYLTGNLYGNNSTLVKVIAAVLKFSPQQTQVAVEKEHQKHTLLGQFNNLL